MVNLLAKPIMKHAAAASVTDADPQQAGAHLEGALFRALGPAANPSKPNYGDRIKMFVMNMGRNATLALSVLRNEADFDALAAANASDLATDELKRDLAKEKQAAAEEVQLDWHRKNIDKQMAAAGLKVEKGQFQCIRCKSWRTSYHEKQTRSADEPMTVFVQCLECGKRWRF